MLNIIDVINKLGLDDLRKPDVVEHLICQIGLHNDEKIAVNYGTKYKSYLVSDGMIQYPPQLTDALIDLSKHEINKYIEIGTFNGYTTMFIASYLTRFNPKLTAITIDNSRGIDGNMINELKKRGITLSSLIGTSDDIKGQESDLCFIDGDHNYSWVRRDYENLGKYAKICMLHDINDVWSANNQSDGGAIVFWKELIETPGIYKEYIQKPVVKGKARDYFGIGIKYK